RRGGVTRFSRDWISDVCSSAWAPASHSALRAPFLFRQSLPNPPHPASAMMRGAAVCPAAAAGFIMATAFPLRKAASSRPALAVPLVVEAPHLTRPAPYTRPLGMFIESALPRAWSAVPWARNACCIVILLLAVLVGGAAHAAQAADTSSTQAPTATDTSELTPARLADLLED